MELLRADGASSPTDHEGKRAGSEKIQAFDFFKGNPGITDLYDSQVGSVQINTYIFFKTYIKIF